MPETDHEDKRNGRGKYLLPIATIIITIIAIAGRFACVSERARNASLEDTVEYAETVVVMEEASKEPLAIPEAPDAPTVNVQIQSW